MTRGSRTLTPPQYPNVAPRDVKRSPGCAQPLELLCAAALPHPRVGPSEKLVAETYEGSVGIALQVRLGKAQKAGTLKQSSQSGPAAASPARHTHFPVSEWHEGKSVWPSQSRPSRHFQVLFPHSAVKAPAFGVSSCPVSAVGDASVL